MGPRLVQFSFGALIGSLVVAWEERIHDGSIGESGRANRRRGIEPSMSTGDNAGWGMRVLDALALARVMPHAGS